jgi:hypothetical protein
MFARWTDCPQCLGYFGNFVPYSTLSPDLAIEIGFIPAVSGSLNTGRLLDTDDRDSPLLRIGRLRPCHSQFLSL